MDGLPGAMTDTITKRLQDFHYRHGPHGLYDDSHEPNAAVGSSFSIAAKLGLKMPNLAPEVEVDPRPVAPPVRVNTAPTVGFPMEVESSNPLEPKKKKYAKEAWPGKKPMPSLLV